MNKDERAVALRIAGEVRRARKERGWSQLELAERSNISVNYVSLIERAERLPSVEVMIQLAATLGTTLANLVNEPAEGDPWLVEGTALLRALPPDARTIVLGMLRGASDAARPSGATPAGKRPGRHRAEGSRTAGSEERRASGRPRSTGSGPKRASSSLGTTGAGQK